MIVAALIVVRRRHHIARRVPEYIFQTYSGEVSLFSLPNNEILCRYRLPGHNSKTLIPLIIIITVYSANL